MTSAPNSGNPDELLRKFLGADPPPGVQALPVDAQRELVDLLHEARRRQDATLEAAFTATLKHVPFPVRGIVKKVLLG